MSLNRNVEFAVTGTRARPSPEFLQACRNTAAYLASSRVAGDGRARTSALRQRITAARAAIAPIGIMTGRALQYDVPFFSWNRKQHRSGVARREKYARGCLDLAVRDGGQVLRVDHHEGSEVPGELRLESTSHALYFQFSIDNTTRGREVLANARAGRYRGMSICSVCACMDEQHAQRDDAGVFVHQRCELLEISLVEFAWPQCAGTYVDVVSVT